MKHIFEMGDCPTALLSKLEKIESNGDDVYYRWASQCKRFFTDCAPVESCISRLDRYLAFLDEKRPSGIVEITLILKGTLPQKVWVPIIKERGFREVTPEGGVYNINSGNHVGVFHRYTKDGVVI